MRQAAKIGGAHGRGPTHILGTRPFRRNGFRWRAVFRALVSPHGLCHHVHFRLLFVCTPYGEVTLVASGNVSDVVGFGMSPSRKDCRVAGGSTVVTFSPVMLWELLDPQVLQDAQKPSIGPDFASQAVSVGDASIRITTHFAHPLMEEKNQMDRSSPPDDNLASADPFSPRFQEFEHIPVDDFFPYLTPGELNWFRPS